MAPNPLNVISVLQVTGHSTVDHRAKTKCQMFLAPSQILMNGLDGKQRKVLPIELSSFKQGTMMDQFYHFTGRVIRSNPQEPPVIHYDMRLTYEVTGSVAFGQSLANQTVVAGLGKVIARTVPNDPKVKCIVTMEHEDYDNISRTYQTFLAHYLVPSEGVISKAQHLFQVGRSMMVTGVIIDWDRNDGGFIIEVVQLNRDEEEDSTPSFVQVREGREVLQFGAVNEDASSFQPNQANHTNDFSKDSLSSFC